MSVSAASTFAAVTTGNLTTGGTLSVSAASVFAAVTTGNLTTAGTLSVSAGAVFQNVTVGGTLFGADGTGTLPSIRFFNDATGLYNSAGILGFSVNGVSKATLSNTGLELVGTLSVSAASVFAAIATANATVGGTLSVSAASTFAAVTTGNLTTAGTLSVSAGAAFQNVTIGGTLSVSAGAVFQNVTVGGTISVSAGAVFTIGIAVGGATAGTGGVAFPATAVAVADANTLDDYEEGTWTPTLGGTTTYTVQDGKYTKIGRLVHIICRIVVNVQGTGDVSVISGLPFTVNSLIPGVLTVKALGSITNIVSITADANISTTTMTLRSRTAASASDGGNAIFGNGTEIRVSGAYEI